MQDTAVGVVQLHPWEGYPRGLFFGWHQSFPHPLRYLAADPTDLSISVPRVGADGFDQFLKAHPDEVEAVGDWLAAVSVSGEIPWVSSDGRRLAAYLRAVEQGTSNAVSISWAWFIANLALTLLLPWSMVYLSLDVASLIRGIK